jgi:hypothetical protein
MRGISATERSATICANESTEHVPLDARMLRLPTRELFQEITN